MSEVAGRMSAQIGAEFLQKLTVEWVFYLVACQVYQRQSYYYWWRSSTNAAKIALGLGADVTILDVNPKRLAELEDLFDGRVNTIMSNPLNIENAVKE